MIKRGYIYTADLNPRFGTEAGKLRPVLVIQTDLLNTAHLSTLVCPLTTKVKSGFVVLRVHLKKGEGSLSCDSDILIDQIRAIDNSRFKKELGKISFLRLKEVEEKIKNIFDLF